GVAIAASSSYVHQQEIRLEEGATGTVSGHEFTFVGMETADSPEKSAIKALVRIDGGQVYAPAMSTFTFSGMTVPTPSVRTGFTEDVMLSISRLPTEEGGPVTLRVTIQPLVVW